LPCAVWPLRCSAFAPSGSSRRLESGALKSRAVWNLALLSLAPFA
jgi:hypothetical protein